MSTIHPLPLTEVEQALITADALIGAFEDHRASMDPTDSDDLLRERKLHGQASDAVRTAKLLAAFEAHANDAIDLTGGQR